MSDLGAKESKAAEAPKDDGAGKSKEKDKGKKGKKGEKKEEELSPEDIALKAREAAGRSSGGGLCVWRPLHAALRARARVLGARVPPLPLTPGRPRARRSGWSWPSRVWASRT